MQDFQSQAESILMSEMTNAGLEISPKENDSGGVYFLVKSPNGKLSEVFLQPMDLIAQQSSKVPKEKLGEPKESLWVALVGFIPEKEPLIFLIPSKTVVKPDDFVFFEHDVSPHTYLSNWEIKVFTNGMKVLGEFVFHNKIENFK
ncbi:hypothetical protein FK220_011620 [Flavobacteriaceae bacterium TP-CH-4]|uniref:Uncharacterized protein n=1 Tax=Pelagihabitans pacificus TaxID=2696054 RepID=A0A967AU09_9FLAO|nr:hypothetical protein [Pelagihabitans pacificus]NHF59994.1 hypothetical protein [Pelagihabitans pacificus]